MTVIEEFDVGFVAYAGPCVCLVAIDMKAIAVRNATFQKEIACRGVGTAARLESQAGFKCRYA